MRKKSDSPFEHIELHSAIVFWVLAMALGAFASCAFLDISVNTTLAIGIGCCVVSIIALICKFNTTSYILLSCSIGFLLFANAQNGVIHFPDKIIPQQPATISGNVVQITKQNAEQTQLILSGWMDAQTLPKMDNIRIRLTIYPQEDKPNGKAIQVGDSILTVCTIRTPRMKFLNEAFDERTYARGIDVNWFGSTTSDKVKTLRSASGYQHLRNVINTAIIAKINTLFTSSTAAFVKAILLADRSDLSYETQQNFSLSGVAHLLSLSGFHIAILSGAFILLLNIFTRNRWLKFICFVFFVIAFVWLTGMQHSAIRSGAMSILFLTGWVIQRPTNPLNVVSIVLLAAMFISPSMLFAASFQMSMLSICGIMLFYPVIRCGLINLFNVEKEQKRRLYVINSLTMTLSASVLIDPLVAYYFHCISILSPLTNIIVIPIFSLGLVASLVSVCCSFISISLGTLFATAVEWCVELCQWLAMSASSLSFAAITNIYNITFLATLSSIAVVYILLAGKWRVLLLRLCVCVSVIFAVSVIATNTEDDAVEVYPTEKYCILSIPLADGEKFIWLADRYPKQKYFNASRLKNFVEEQNVKYIAVSGSFGYEFAKENNIGNKYKIRMLTSAEQKHLERMYLNGRNIRSIIQYYKFIPNEKYSR
ncbi:MAG: ComEC/Rec2 family competence protein [Ignavibacteria bacterium]|jgi:competence protein ComEC|nr:ComEC/Rec2 family competence protein [Ignavibacteria bacterium]